MGIIEISYFSDVLCVWAYISEVRIDAIKEKFGEAVRIEHHFCSVFGDTATKVNTMWKEKGGYAGFNAHLRQAATKFPHVEVHPDLWLSTRPATSMSAHLFLKAVQLGEGDLAARKQPPGTFDRAHSGAAFAALAADHQEAERLRIEGSPSLVLNQGRQKLYGNIGFWLIEANVQSLMRTPASDDASWC